METIKNLTFDSIQHTKRSDISRIIEYAYKHKTINETTLTDRTTYLTDTNVLETNISTIKTLIT